MRYKAFPDFFNPHTLHVQGMERDRTVAWGEVTEGLLDPPIWRVKWRNHPRLKPGRISGLLHREVQTVGFDPIEWMLEDLDYQLLRLFEPTYMGSDPRRQIKRWMNLQKIEAQRHPTILL